MEQNLNTLDNLTKLVSDLTKKVDSLTKNSKSRPARSQVKNSDKGKKPLPAKKSAPKKNPPELVARPMVKTVKIFRKLASLPETQPMLPHFPVLTPLTVNHIITPLTYFQADVAKAVDEAKKLSKKKIQDMADPLLAEAKLIKQRKLMEKRDSKKLNPREFFLLMSKQEREETYAKVGTSISCPIHFSKFGSSHTIADCILYQKFLNFEKGHSKDCPIHAGHTAKNCKKLNETCKCGVAPPHLLGLCNTFLSYVVYRELAKKSK
jgi:hypothetical protein